jgi:hypothetical protein
MAERTERASESKGLTCPQCGCRHFYVYTRPRAGEFVRQKRCRYSDVFTFGAPYHDGPVIIMVSVRHPIIASGAVGDSRYRR